MIKDFIFWGYMSYKTAGVSLAVDWVTPLAFVKKEKFSARFLGGCGLAGKKVDNGLKLVRK
jgi:hypothetical protein